MRKIIMFNMVSVDGFFARPNGEIDWHVVDHEFSEFALSQLDEVGALLFGRVTYDMMAAFWPSETARLKSSATAEKMNSKKKIVFSKSLEKADWENSQVLSGINPDEIMKLKQEEGKDMLLLGSGTIVSQLTQLKLIDEYRLKINPVILGKGKMLFAGIEEKVTLELLKTKIFASGNILACYRPKK